MIISIPAEKAFGKIQHPFMIKAPKRLGMEGLYLNIPTTLKSTPRKFSDRTALEKYCCLEQVFCPSLGHPA